MFLAELMARFGGENEVDLCHLLVTNTFPEIRSTDKQVDVFAMLKTAGVSVREVASEKFEGKFEWDDEGNETVTLSEQKNPFRRRFTAAHELGHWILRKISSASATGVRFRSSSPHMMKVDEEEKIANLLAAEMLLPLSALLPLIKHETISISLVKRLSTRFQVSREVVFRRIAQVLNTTLVHLNLVPNRFNDLDSHAIVDDANYVVPNEGLIVDRHSPRLTRRVRFSDIFNKRNFTVGVRGSRGRITAKFELSSSKWPIPNIDLLAVDVIFQNI